MSPSLSDCYVRLNGAQNDLEVFNTEVGRWLGQDVYSVVDEDDPHSGYRLLGIRIAAPPPDWGRRAGHIVNDIRTALEYLVYQLAWLDSGTVQANTQFPICDTPDAFKAELKKNRLIGLNSDHIKAIERCQPYNIGRSWIRQVRELSNPDKHRYINHAVATNWPPVPSIAGAVTLTRQHKPHRLMNKPGAEPPLASQLDVQMSVSVGVSFSDGSPVIETLKVLEAGVRGIIDAFQPEF